jgi:hypothetical protein
MACCVQKIRKPSESCGLQSSTETPRVCLSRRSIVRDGSKYLELLTVPYMQIIQDVSCLGSSPFSPNPYEVRLSL